MIFTKLSRLTGLILFLSIISTNCSLNRGNSYHMETQKSSASNTLGTPLKTSTPNITDIITTPIRQITAVITTQKTPVPNLDSQEIIDKWREIMINPVCHLPCWWGIKPGFTKGYEAQELLKPMEVNLQSEQGPNGYILYGAPFHILSKSLINFFSLLENNEIIEVIQVQGEGLNNPSGFNELWEKYSPEVILKTYDLPSRIVIQTRKNSVQPKDPTYKYYDLSLFYDQLGFVIMYGGRVENNPSHKICPSFNGNFLSEIQIYAQSQSSQIPLENIMGENYGPLESVYNLRDASGLTVNEFFSYVTDSENPRCFDTIADIWPP
jgi:hypothetical protein